jgi:hypothetical protein
MLSTSSGLPFAVTAVSTELRYRLGELYEVWHPTYGQQIHRYIRNESGSTLSIGLGAMQENGTDLYKANLSGVATATARMLGVAQVAIVNDSYGFVLCNGVGICQSDGTTTANVGQKAVAAGQFSDAVIGTDDIPVHALETEAPAGAAGVFLAMVRCL